MIQAIRRILGLEPAPIQPTWLYEPTYETLRFFYYQDDAGRVRAEIIVSPTQWDDVNPNGWASIAELEADLPRVISERYEANVGGTRSAGIVVLAHYHARSRTMLVLARPRPNDWQMEPEGKKQIESGLIEARIPGTNQFVARPPAYEGEVSDKWR